MSRLPSPRSRAAVPAALCLGLVVAVTGCSSEKPASTSSPQKSPSASASTTPGEGTDSPSPTASATTGGTAVPVYFAGQAGNDVRLFREFQRVTGDPLTEAALLVDGGTPLDPDYLTLWPGGAVERAAIEGDVITVTLKSDAFTVAPDGMEPEDAELALQQMVRTLQGAARKRLPVRFVRSTGPSTLFGIDVSAPVRRGDWSTTLAFVNVTTPAQGSTVTGDTLVAEGVGSSFEATIPWELRRDTEVVRTGFATADGWMDKLYPWKAEVDLSGLEPGVYTFHAMTDDPSGGEGDAPTVDTKEFTLE